MQESSHAHRILPNMNQPVFRENPKPKKRGRRPGVIALAALLVAVSVGFLLAGSPLLSVKSITIMGNRLVPATEIADISGIRPGDAMLRLNPAQIEANINAHSYLTFVSLARDFPSRVILTVEERTPRARLRWMGDTVLLGEDGVVLDPSLDLAEGMDVLTVTGVQVLTARVGSPVSFSMKGQLDAMRVILRALEAQGMAREFSELNLSALDNLYLVTTDGLQVMLGSDINMAAKLENVRATLPLLREIEEVRGALLDVTTGTAADFRPAK